ASTTVSRRFSSCGGRRETGDATQAAPLANVHGSVATRLELERIPGRAHGIDGRMARRGGRARDDSRASRQVRLGTDDSVLKRARRCAFDETLRRGLWSPRRIRGGKQIEAVLGQGGADEGHDRYRADGRGCARRWSRRRLFRERVHRSYVAATSGGDRCPICAVESRRRERGPAAWHVPVERN